MRNQALLRNHVERKIGGAQERGKTGSQEEMEDMSRDNRETDNTSHGELRNTGHSVVVIRTGRCLKELPRRLRTYQSDGHRIQPWRRPSVPSPSICSHVQPPTGAWRAGTNGQAEQSRAARTWETAREKRGQPSRPPCYRWCTPKRRLGNTEPSSHCLCTNFLEQRNSRLIERKHKAEGKWS